MSLTNEQVQHIAKLARLHLSDEELEQYRDQLSSILDYVDKLGALDTEGVEELQFATEISNVFRQDDVKGCEEDVRTRAIDNFSNREGDLLKVQAVFENRTE